MERTHLWPCGCNCRHNQATRSHQLNYCDEHKGVNAALVAALKEAKETIRTWHGMNVPKQGEPELWEYYQSSPEMKQIKAALKSAEVHHAAETTTEKKTI